MKFCINPELLILRGAIDMEFFIKNITKDNRMINNIPIEWIMPNNNIIDSFRFLDTTIYNLLIISGYIICYMSYLYNYLKNIFIKKY